MIREAIKKDCVKIDNLLSLLIQDERQYDDNISPFFEVIDYYKNFIERKDNICYVYEIDNDIIAYIDGKIVNDGTELNDTFKINALFVKEEYRNKKIASSLIEKLIEELEKRNIKNIEIGVMSDNKIAKKLYQKYGFKTYKEIMILKK